jgi:flagellar protein FliJ
MRPSERMQIVADSAQERMQEVAARLASARNRFEQKQEKLRELERYRDEYMQGLLHKSRAGLGALQMKDYNVFLDRLNEAIQLQANLLESARLEIERCVQQWHDAQQRCNALDRVVESKLQTERLMDERREQKEENEFARRGWQRETG